ncbi:hypothetical protein CDD83_5731 [Cordyceps sp. RAO-2017]|nr:hypothetical protein CDD83_5731 [Cordyceps sp. RAO-2017]
MEARLPCQVDETDPEPMALGRQSPTGKEWDRLETTAARPPPADSPEDDLQRRGRCDAALGRDEEAAVAQFLGYGSKDWRSGGLCWRPRKPLPDEDIDSLLHRETQQSLALGARTGQPEGAEFKGREVRCDRREPATDGESIVSSVRIQLSRPLVHAQRRLPVYLTVGTTKLPPLLLWQWWDRPT